MENEVINALLTRRSIRKFKPQQVTDDELTTVLNAGTYAPTGMGRQNPWIIAVQNPEIKQRLVRMNAAVMGTSSNPYYDAPTIVLVFGSDPKVWKNSVQDGSLVLGTMMVAAHAIGLGSCWINREMEMFSTAEGRQLMNELGLPEGLIGIGALALGYPDGDAPKAKPRKADYYRILK